MRSTEQLNVTVPAEMASMIKARVASGEYASESEVIRDGLRALQARDRAVEQWLREVATPSLDATKADPTRAKTVAQIRASLADEHARAVAGT